MDKYTATELAYKHGYEKGYEAGKPKWIPVSERLPDIHDSYIVIVKHKYYFQKHYVYDVDVATFNAYGERYIDGCWDTYNDWNEGQQYLHITHWMPMPEPLKEGE